MFLKMKILINVSKHFKGQSNRLASISVSKNSIEQHLYIHRVVK